MPQSTDTVTLCLCGDVMLGRGVDQILPHAGDPTLREVYANDARAYVDLAAAVNGPIPRPVGFSWPWGDALPTIDDVAPDVRVINLETSITSSGDFAPAKSLHYRMHPGNLRCLAIARPDACALANNHVMDFGAHGLADTLNALSGAGLQAVGAGRDAGEARRPAIVSLEEDRRVVILSYGVASSGIPSSWAATSGLPGINFIAELSGASAAEVAGQVGAMKRPGDVVVASLHWGSNWGYTVLPDQIRFAHQLIDSGVDVIHGHSSHHPRPIEVYRGKLILYGCGDLINDYEGISGYDKYRDDLRNLYLASIAPDTGKLVNLRIIPMQARKMRLHRASSTDIKWLQATLDDVCRQFGSRIGLEPEGVLVLHCKTAG
ncbi:MAG TPA: CapA family protein [Pseudonocardiaceae bacterium]|jgi:poly-gamma-glutamate capsule biosynthesis protein CapA/YwtB (metallophosphatase superfamily)|nr:CapA family protein [Pseudonocardiaceae bacterium]